MFIAQKPALAHRVVSLNLCSDQLLAMLAPEQVAGLEPLARDPALSFVALQAVRLPMVRNDAEAVLAKNPDLVLAGPYAAQTTVALLRERGVQVLVLDDPTDFAGIAAQTMQLATVLGVPERGQRLVDAMWQRLRAIRPRRGSAIFMEAQGWTAGPRTLADAVLRAAGLRNTGTGGRIGVESLAVHPPDVLVTGSAPDFPSLATDFLWHPALAGIARATVPPALMACAGPYSVGAVESLTQ